MFPAPGVLEKFIKLFAIQKKSELEKYCSGLTITQEDLVQLILWSQLIGYAHNRCHLEYQPIEAQPAPRDLEALHSSDDVIRAERLRKLVNKFKNLFEVRKYLSAHLFVSPSRWHLFYFSFRDIDGEGKNHWRHGSHVHFLNDLWPHYRLEQLYDLLFSGRWTQVSDSIHIRFTEAGEE